MGLRMFFEFKTKPYEHQKEALKRSLVNSTSPAVSYAWLMEMGTGKSKVACDEMGILYARDQIDIAVIFAPKGVYNNWIKQDGELATHMAVPYTAAKWEAGGGNKANQRALEKLLKPNDTLRILVINIEALSSGKKAMIYLEKFLKSGKAYGIVDESTKIKNPQSNRCKNLLSLRSLIDFRRIASGSPVTKNPLDLYGQFSFLDPKILGHNSFYSFRARYAVMQEKNFGSRRVKIVVGYRNEEELSYRIKDHSYRVLKEDCLDIPPKVYSSREVELTDEQMRVYLEMKNEAFAQFKDTFVSANNAITILMRLQQIVCGHFVDNEGVLHRLQTNRIDALLEEIEEVDSDVIIWSRYRDDISRIVDALRENYGEESVAQFHGGNTKTRDAEAHRFTNDDRCRFIVSTQQSGGYGNTWLNGRHVVYYSNSEDLELRLQSEDRPHRAGQKKTVSYCDLITPGTVQEKIVKSLRNKMDIAATILSDNPREWLI